jgi:hypothetical protein
VRIDDNAIPRQTQRAALRENKQNEISNALSHDLQDRYWAFFESAGR